MNGFKKLEKSTIVELALHGKKRKQYLTKVQEEEAKKDIENYKKGKLSDFQNTTFRNNI